jgi:hypothetical protein
MYSITVYVLTYVRQDYSGRFFSNAVKKVDSNSNTAEYSVLLQEFPTKMELEIATLEALGAWEVLEYDSGTMPNVIQLTWAFKCKRFPDGLIKKLKACFCA